MRSLYSTLPQKRCTDGSEVTVDSDLAAEVQLAVMRLARQLRLQRTEGLTASQFSALATLARSGPLALGALAEAESVAPPSMTRTVESLVGKGLVCRRRVPGDARVTEAELTETGEQLVAQVRRVRRAWLFSRLESLDEHELTTVIAALPALRKLSES